MGQKWKIIEASLLRHDVVLVSYQTLASELKKHWPARLSEDSEEAKITDIPDLKALNSLKERKEYWSPFYCNESKFYRIILDEAQNIKNKKTQSAKASLLYARCNVSVGPLRYTYAKQHHGVIFVNSFLEDISL